MAVLWWHEPFTRLHGMSFGLIWAALALYTWDAVAKARAIKAGLNP
jgi:chloramphenicol-sensitive protein RarD